MMTKRMKMMHNLTGKERQKDGNQHQQPEGEKKKEKEMKKDGVTTTMIKKKKRKMRMMKKKKSKKTKTMMKITTEGAKKEKCLQPQNLKTKQHHPGGEVDANGGLEGGEAIDGREEDEATRTSSNPI